MKIAAARLLTYPFALLAAASVGIVGLGSLNLYTYQRFASESPVAQIRFTQTGPRSFSVTMNTADGAVRQFALRGDEWQLDVRMIKWTDWMTFLGEQPMYRLDRMAGRYVSVEEQRSQPPTVHALHRGDVVDLWAFARRAGDWLPGIDAAYGSSVFLPMLDGAAYEVTLSRTGLVARAISSEGAP